ncbi:hypothetical protein Tco_1114912 [Tanacetum coccineum]
MSCPTTFSDEGGSFWNCMELSERMRQKDVVIGVLEQTGSREKIVRAVAYLREIQNRDMEKLDWYREMVIE